jgi:hypothetical protein
VVVLKLATGIGTRFGRFECANVVFGAFAEVVSVRRPSLFMVVDAQTAEVSLDERLAD